MGLLTFLIIIIRGIALLVAAIGLLLQHVAAALALGHKPYAEEDEEDGYGMGRLEDAKAGQDAYYDRYKRLDIVVHTDHRGTQYLLGLHGENVAEKGADHDYERCL